MWLQPNIPIGSENLFCKMGVKVVIGLGYAYGDESQRVVWSKQVLSKQGSR